MGGHPRWVDGVLWAAQLPNPAPLAIEAGQPTFPHRAFASGRVALRGGRGTKINTLALHMCVASPPVIP